MPLIKITQGRNTPGSPFYGPEMDKMGVFPYAAEYTKYGLLCVFDIN